MFTRRFLVPPALTRLVRYHLGSAPITEGFFEAQPGRSVLLRVSDKGAHLVLSTPREDEDAEEVATALPAEHAAVLLTSCAGRVSFEQSSLALVDGQEVLVRRFDGASALATVSVTFPNKDSATHFAMPIWFGAEVTDDGAYTNRGLALGGIPRLGEVSISDLALDAIMDVLESQREPAQEPREADIAVAQRSGTDLPPEILSTLTMDMDRTIADTAEDKPEEDPALRNETLSRLPPQDPRADLLGFRKAMRSRAGFRRDESSEEGAAGA
jgi:CYTH domain-containing protein